MVRGRCRAQLAPPANLPPGAPETRPRFRPALGAAYRYPSGRSQVFAHGYCRHSHRPHLHHRCRCRRESWSREERPKGQVKRREEGGGGRGGGGGRNGDGNASGIETPRRAGAWRGVEGTSPGKNVKIVRSEGKIATLRPKYLHKLPPPVFQKQGGACRQGRGSTAVRSSSQR